MKKIRCAYESFRVSNREARRRAKRDLARGLEPLRQYRTGKFWTD